MLSPSRSADDAHQLIDLGVRFLRPVTLAEHAAAGMAVEEAERDLVERRLHGGDLRDHVDAVAILLDHPGDPVAPGANRLDHPLAYAKDIRAWLEANGGRPHTPRRAVADRPSQPSLR